MERTVTATPAAGSTGDEVADNVRVSRRDSEAVPMCDCEDEWGGADPSGDVRVPAAEVPRVDARCESPRRSRSIEAGRVSMRGAERAEACSPAVVILAN